MGSEVKVIRVSSISAQQLQALENMGYFVMICNPPKKPVIPTRPCLKIIR